MRFTRAYLPITIFFVVLSGYQIANAEGIEEEIIVEKNNLPSDIEKQSIWQRTLNSLESFRDNTSNNYVALSESIDKYFYGKELEETSNHSYLKLELDNTFHKAGEMKQDVKLRAKLDLPNTKKRLKFVFTSSADKEKTLGERVTSDATGKRVSKDGSFAGLEYTPEPEKTTWKSSITGGIKPRIPLLPFAKWEIENTWQLPANWSSELDQSFWYFNDQGFGETSTLDFSKSITDSHRVKITPELEYRDDEKTFYYDLIFSSIHRLTPESSITYYTGAIGASQPTNQVTSYILGAKYKKLLHEDWLFLTAEPWLTFPRDENWNAQPSFTIGLQVFFTGNEKK